MARHGILYYGVLLVLEKYVLHPVIERLPGAVRHIYALFFVVIGWVIFAAPSLSSAVHYIHVMFGGGTAADGSAGVYYLYNYLIILILCALCSGPGVTASLNRCIVARERRKRIFVIALYIAAFICSIAFLVNATYNPFLYFRF